MIASGVDGVIRDDVIAERNALIADIPIRSGDNFRDLVLRLPAKRTGSSRPEIIHLPFPSATDRRWRSRQHRAMPR